jgi:hypothetical protein
LREADKRYPARNERRTIRGTEIKGNRTVKQNRKITTKEKSKEKNNQNIHQQLVPTPRTHPLHPEHDLRELFVPSITGKRTARLMFMELSLSSLHNTPSNMQTPLLSILRLVLDFRRIFDAASFNKCLAVAVRLIALCLTTIIERLFSSRVDLGGECGVVAGPGVWQV